MWWILYLLSGFSTCGTLKTNLVMKQWIFFSLSLKKKSIQMERLKRINTSFSLNIIYQAPSSPQFVILNLQFRGRNSHMTAYYKLDMHRKYCQDTKLKDCQWFFLVVRSWLIQLLTLNLTIFAKVFFFYIRNTHNFWTKSKLFWKLGSTLMLVITIQNILKLAPRNTGTHFLSPHLSLSRVNN